MILVILYRKDIIDILYSKDIFLRHEFWSGLSFHSPGDLLDPEIEPGSPALQGSSL